MKAWFKRVFVPHEGNGYAPHSLEKMAVMGMAAMVIFTFMLSNLQAILWVTSDWMVSTILPAIIVEDTNVERATGALGTLRRSTVLDAAAQLKANDMAAHSYFAHTSPTGVTPWYWFGQAGYNYVHAGENLAVHFTDSDEVVEAWMNSPTHRANIMDGQFTEIGIGVAEGEYEGFQTVFVVQLFGTPAAAPAVAQVAGDSVPPPVVVPAPRATSTVVLGATEADTVAGEPTPADSVLASTVTLSETIERMPAEPVAEMVSTTPSTTPPAEADVVTVATTEHGSAVYLDTVSTTTAGIPASVEGTGVHSESVPLWARMATAPHLWLQLVYGLIASFVLVALALSVVIEVRRQQPVQIAYSIGLLALMGGLMYLHVMLTAGGMVV